MPPASLKDSALGSHGSVLELDAPCFVKYQDSSWSFLREAHVN